tara:strand:- start:234 stop:581 length:348 start_codon:yes stop_codon:yes gene_type:complete
LKSKKLINHFKKDVIMRKFLLILPILFATTTEVNADTEVRLVPAEEIVKSIGVFTLDTGKKICEGATTTIFGIGEIITAPFRADTYKPKKRLYYFQRPRLEIDYDAGKFFGAKYR